MSSHRSHSSLLHNHSVLQPNNEKQVLSKDNLDEQLILNNKRTSNDSTSSSSSSRLIVLKGKLGIPVGFGPEKSRKNRYLSSDDSSSVTSSVNSLDSNGLKNTTKVKALTSINLVLKERKGKFVGNRLGRVREEFCEDGEEGEEDVDKGVVCSEVGEYIPTNEMLPCSRDGEKEKDGEDDNADSDYDDDDDDDETVMTTASMIRLRGESPEQRRARKALVSSYHVKLQLKNYGHMIILLMLLSIFYYSTFCVV